MKQLSNKAGQYHSGRGWVNMAGLLKKPLKLALVQLASGRVGVTRIILL